MGGGHRTGRLFHTLVSKEVYLMAGITELDLERMRNMDVREVDPATLPDIADIHIDTSQIGRAHV